MAKLKGMARIIKFQGKTESTIMGLIQNEGYPAACIDGEWVADTDEIEKWRESYRDGEKTTTSNLAEPGKSIHLGPQENLQFSQIEKNDGELCPFAVTGPGCPFAVSGRWPVNNNEPKPKIAERKKFKKTGGRKKKIAGKKAAKKQ